MSTTFILPQFHNPDSPVLNVTLDVDDGDLNLNINGIRVAYITAEEGVFCRSYLDDEDRNALSGLQINKDGYLMMYTDGDYR